jgi:putative ABC transport system permease protein
VTIEEAQAEMDTLTRRAEQDNPAMNKGWGARVHSLHEYAVGGYRTILYLLLGAVGFVLLMACANVANLLLARAAARQKEIAVRASLGAGRLRLVRQFLTESVLLAVLGGALGVLVADWGNRIFIALAPNWFARASEVRLDLTVLGFTLALSVATGILFGLVPAVQASRPDLNESLKEAGGRSTVGSRQRGRSLLVISEVALALVLLIGAGLMINSFLRLQNVELGFDTDNVMTAEVLLAGPKYYQLLGGDMKKVTPQGVVFFDDVVQRLKLLPGVESVSIAHMAPPGFMADRVFRIIGAADGTRPQGAGYSEVSAEFFRTLRIPLLKGRYLTDRDDEGSPWVAVINKAMASRHFPKEEPVGKYLQLTVTGGSAGVTVEEGQPRQIVGVVGDVRQWGPANEPVPTIYTSYRQRVWEYPGGGYTTHLRKHFVIRTASDPMALAGAVQKVVAEVDKDQVVYNLRTLEQVLSEFLGPWRFFMRLFGIFGGLAVLLATVGIYGVMSNAVNRRTHEFGVRMANGAERRDILKLVLLHGLKVTLIGVVIGVAGSLALTRLIAGLLHGVKPTDPVTFTAVAVFLTGIALLAAYIPARRASKVDPMVALRYE